MVGNNIVRFLNGAKYCLRVLSITTLIVWYNVLHQCFYNDWQVLASKCKNLLAFQMIMERQMSSLCGSLPFINHAAKMQMNDATTKVDVELNTNAEKVESWKSQIHMLIDVAKWLEHRLSSMNKVAIEDCLQKLAIATHPIVWFRCTTNKQTC